MIYAVPVVFTIACWTVSLRRTPYATLWLFPCVLFAMIGVTILAAVEEAHHLTTAGIMGGLIGSIMLPSVSAFVTEACAQDKYNDVKKWRDEHPDQNWSGRVGSR